jgi:hypothetical protein
MAVEENDEGAVAMSCRAARAGGKPRQA